MCRSPTLKAAASHPRRRRQPVVEPAAAKPAVAKETKLSRQLAVALHLTLALLLLPASVEACSRRSAPPPDKGSPSGGPAGKPDVIPTKIPNNRPQASCREPWATRYCLHGGKCLSELIDGIISHHCNCTHDWWGERCQERAFNVSLIVTSEPHGRRGRRLQVAETPIVDGAGSSRATHGTRRRRFAKSRRRRLQQKGKRLAFVFVRRNLSNFPTPVNSLPSRPFLSSYPLPSPRPANPRKRLL